MKKRTACLLGLLVLMTFNSCIHTSKITKLYNNGAHLKSTDVVLFTGFNGEHSSTSNNMMSQTERILKKYGVEVHYLHTSNFNSEIVKAGFTATKADIRNEDFLDKMTKVYGLSYIFTVSDIRKYDSGFMPVDRNSKMLDESGVVFEVFSVTDRQVVASMQLSGDTIHFYSIHDDDADRTHGNIYKNYGKGLRKLMKASKY